MNKLPMFLVKTTSIYLLLFTFIFSACKDKGSDTKDNSGEVIQEQTDAEGADWENEEDGLPVSQQITLLLDSITVFRENAFASENEKINSTDLFIEEVSSTITDYDATKLDELKTLQQATAAAMYDEVTLGDEKVMEAYDEATAQMLAKMKEVKESIPDFDRYARAKVLYEDVFKADANDFLLRNTRYNEYVSRYNSVLTENAEDVKNMPSLNALEPWPLFYGGPVN